MALKTLLIDELKPYLNVRLNNLKVDGDLDLSSVSFGDIVVDNIRVNADATVSGEITAPQVNTAELYANTAVINGSLTSTVNNFRDLEISGILKDDNNTKFFPTVDGIDQIGFYLADNTLITQMDTYTHTRETQQGNLDCKINVTIPPAFIPFTLTEETNELKIKLFTPNDLNVIGDSVFTMLVENLDNGGLFLGTGLISEDTFRPVGDPAGTSIRFLLGGIPAGSNYTIHGFTMSYEALKPA